MHRCADRAKRLNTSGQITIAGHFLLILLCAMNIGCRAVESAGPFAHEHRTLTPTPGTPLVGSGDYARPSLPIEVRPEGGLTECIASFNADVPTGAGVVLEVAPARSDGSHSLWLRLASWGEVPEAWPDRTQAPGATVAIDELLLEEPAHAVWVRVVAFDTGEPVRVRRVDVVATRADPTRDLSPAPGARIEWPVPFIPNEEVDPSLRSRLCSPTALNMLLNHRAPDVRHPRVVETVYSERFDLYGVWPRAIQTAWQFGVPGSLVRFADWHEVRAHLESVGPIAISITARPGEVRNMPYESDNGHLIVLAGLTERGDAIVIDPALRNEDEARRIYRAKDLSKVWLRRKRGTAYALEAP